jgi:aerobic-type carbon monoxide dehydrogenase small subunit (CoxS/CutS family)
VGTKIIVMFGNDPCDLGAHEGEVLVHTLRKHGGMASVLAWCTDGTCGACRILLDGKLVLSCKICVSSALHGARIDTRETLDRGAVVKRALAVFDQERPTRCRLCVGAVAVTAHWLAEHPGQIDEALAGLRCSCTGRGSLRRALTA